VSRRKRKLSPILVVSLCAHVAVIAALALIPQERLREVVSIALNEVAKPEPKEARPPASPKPARAEASQHARSAPAPRASAQPSAADTATAARAFTDLGLTLDSNSADGLAVNTGPGAGALRAAAPKALAAPRAKLLVSNKALEPSETITKPKPINPSLPAFTDAARMAGVQGKVILELIVNETGEVTDARVVKGLGYGLDEAALAAAKKYRFAPATQAGRAVAFKFVLAMRFLSGT
jgi:protein TonB